MRILLVSMPSLHFFRWTEQLEHSGHEVYWFDILDGAPTKRLPWVHQIKAWKLKFPNLKGRHFVKKKYPRFYGRFSFLIEQDTAKNFEKVLAQVKPDVVHSFVLQISCLPILQVMKKYHQIPWVYSSWGSDLYNKANKPNYETELKIVLKTVGYLFTDNLRDYKIAKTYGFKGVFLGVFPGGGGFKYKNLNQNLIPLNKRKIILVKGYQGELGRCIDVIKALEILNEALESYTIIVFAADLDVITYLNKSENILDKSIQVLPKTEFIPHENLLKLMGKSLIYIGNSVSDGMPNTLLEALIMGAFPIQSNPGGATEEVIESYKNGMLIDDCNNHVHIAELITSALNNPELLASAFEINQTLIKPKFEYSYIQERVLKAYERIKL